MIIKVEDNDKSKEVEVTIKGSKDDELVREIYKSLLYFESTIIGKFNDRLYNLSLNDIFYFESIENKTFAYSVNEVYEISEKLYMLETQLEKTPFIRISKSIILNSKKIKSFKNTINGRMEATLKNNEKVKISRMYVTNLKEKLGGTKRWNHTSIIISKHFLF